MIRWCDTIEGKDATSTDRGKKVLTYKNIVKAFGAQRISSAGVRTMKIFDGISKIELDEDSVKTGRVGHRGSS